MHSSPARLLLAIALTFLIAACGDDGESPSAAKPTATATAAAAAAADLEDTTVKPEIPKPAGKAPTRLVKRDIVKGSGTAAKAGDEVSVQYVGVLHSTGEQFDASWDAGEPFSFPLGAGRVIPGWDAGVVGMKPGGRRELTIPPDQAYGPTGSGPIGPDETLVFVIDLLETAGG